MDADVSGGGRALDAASSRARIAQLREQRRSLRQVTKDIMLWIGLLGHKAMSLRTLAGRYAAGRSAGLTPGSLDPKALAAELAAGLKPRRPTAATSRQRPTQDVTQTADELLAQARVVWETAADPADPSACERLSRSAEDVAAQLEDLVNEALDQYRKLGEELVQALKTAGHRNRGDASAEDSGASSPAADLSSASDWGPRTQS